ncbi:MAG: glutamyl-tRNA reductase [Planctomycetes bacterium]|nr:glutamyl-tRNA reductase [Planctomycetota bacterium]
MLGLGLIGVSVHSAPIELVGALTLKMDDRAERLTALKKEFGLDEIVYLATCNRVEFIFFARNLEPVYRLRKKLPAFFREALGNLRLEGAHLYSREGLEVVKHVYSVASSLDSLVIGESQIQHQIRDAFSFAEESNLIGDELRRLFQNAFRVGKKVRRQTDLGDKRVSMATLAHAPIDRFIAEVGEVRAAIIGVGPMCSELALHFSERGVTDVKIVSRTKVRAEEAASQFGAEGVGLVDFICDPSDVNLICTSTAAPHAIFWKADAERILGAQKNRGRLMFVDLAVPRDVDDEVLEIEGVTLEHIGSLRELAEPGAEHCEKTIDEANTIVVHETKKYLAAHIERFLGPLFQMSVDGAEAYVDFGLDGLFSTKLKDLGESGRGAIRYWVTEKLLPHVLHETQRNISRVLTQMRSDSDDGNPSPVLEGAFEAVGPRADRRES